MLRRSIDAKNHKKTKELIYQFKKVLKTLPVRGEEDREIFQQIQQKLNPLLDTLEKTKDHPNLMPHTTNLIDLIHQKLEPQKWKHAA